MSQQVPSIWQQLGQASHQTAPKGSLRQSKLLSPTAVLQSSRGVCVKQRGILCILHVGEDTASSSQWASPASLCSSFRAPWICHREDRGCIFIKHHSSCKEARKTYVLTQWVWEPGFQVIREIIEILISSPGDAADCRGSAAMEEPGTDEVQMD